MRQFIKEVYLTAFTVLYRVGGAAWSPGLNAGKSVAGIAMIEWLFLIGVWCWIDVFIRENTLDGISKPVVFVAFFGLCFANHYPLVILGHGTAFVREFTNLTKSKRVGLLAGFLATLFAVMAFFICATSMHLKLIHQLNPTHQP